jgi:putative peptidoglycan lipid II flippase
MQGLSRVPGLHMALGLASALASYLNLALLWRALRRDGIYESEPGWAKFVLRLLVSCVLMSAVLIAGRWLWPDWSVSTWVRVGRIGALVGAGAATYLATQYAMGFRIRDLRGV